MKLFNKQCCFSVHFSLQVKMLHKFTLFIYLMTVLNDVQCGPLSGPAIHLNVSPGQDDVDIVRSHTVACTLDPRLTSMVKVTALTLYGSRSYGTAGQVDSLATVDLWSPLARPLGGLGDADVDVFGEIGRNDVSMSQLGISWKYQLVSSPKQFKCVINGLDSNGHVVTISITSETSITTPHSIGIGVSDNHGAIDKQQVNSTSTDMESVELNFQNLTSKVEDIGEAVHCLEELIENQSLTTLLKQQTILNELKLAKLASVLDKFDVSAVFQGRRYFVTKAVASFNIRNADFLCEVMGGYLTEIEDKEEYDFLLNFLKGVGGANFFTGANDIDEEGVWAYWHSGKPVTYANWRSGQPNNNLNKKDCMVIRIKFNRSDDWQCTVKAKFVCEVPV